MERVPLVEPLHTRPSGGLRGFSVWRPDRFELVSGTDDTTFARTEPPSDGEPIFQCTIALLPPVERSITARLQFTSRFFPPGTATLDRWLCSHVSGNRSVKSNPHGLAWRVAAENAQRIWAPPTCAIGTGRQRPFSGIPTEPRGRTRWGTISGELTATVARK